MSVSENISQADWMLILIIVVDNSLLKFFVLLWLYQWKPIIECFLKSLPVLAAGFDLLRILFNQLVYLSVEH